MTDISQSPTANNQELKANNYTTPAHTIECML